MLDETGKIRTGAIEALSEENNTQVAKIAWLSNKAILSHNRGHVAAEGPVEHQAKASGFEGRHGAGFVLNLAASKEK